MHLIYFANWNNWFVMIGDWGIKLIWEFSHLLKLSANFVRTKDFEIGQSA